MPATKKSFKTANNPAMEFITAMGNDEQSATDTNIQEEKKPTKSEKSTKPENRTKRFSLAVPPSLFNDLSDASGYEQTSINNLCVEILSQYAADNQTNIEKYRTLKRQLRRDAGINTRG